MRLLLCSAFCLAGMTSTLAAPIDRIFPTLRLEQSAERVTGDVPAFPHAAMPLRPPCGNVTVVLAVSAKGVVTDALLTSPDRQQVFNDAVLQAVKSWRYAPVYSGDLAIPFKIVVPFRFALDGECPEPTRSLSPPSQG
jgi:TonB family protein